MLRRITTTSSVVDPTPRRIGGLRPVGAIGYGLWRFTSASVDVATELIETALDNGLDLIDTSDVYGLDWGGSGFGEVEALLGRVLERSPALRERMVLATKGGIVPPVPYDSSRAALRAACEDSLRRLGVDAIDLYQIHRPDMFTHPAEVADTLMALRDEGKIVEIGVSNHTPAQVEALAAHLDVPIATNQPEFSVAHLDPLRDGTLDTCMRTGTTPLAWSPLGGGAIARGEGLRPELLTTLDEIAAREEVQRTHVALAFVLAHPARPIPLIGTQSPGRIVDCVRALEVRLDRRDVYRIIEASEGRPLP